MTTRLLPREEWDRLVGTELEAVAPVLPDDARVIVVEDGDRIVGTWAAFPLWHAEGLFIAPSHRGNAGVVGRLLKGMRELIRGVGAQTVLTAAISDEVEDYISRIGGTRLPGRHFVVKV